MQSNIQLILAIHSKGSNPKLGPFYLN